MSDIHGYIEVDCIDYWAPMADIGMLFLKNRRLFCLLFGYPGPLAEGAVFQIRALPPDLGWGCKHAIENAVELEACTYVSAAEFLAVPWEFGTRMRRLPDLPAYDGYVELSPDPALPELVEEAGGWAFSLLKVMVRDVVDVVGVDRVRLIVWFTT